MLTKVIVYIYKTSGRGNKRRKRLAMEMVVKVICSPLRSARSGVSSRSALITGEMRAHFRGDGDTKMPSLEKNRLKERLVEPRSPRAGRTIWKRNDAVSLYIKKRKKRNASVPCITCRRSVSGFVCVSRTIWWHITAPASRLTVVRLFTVMVISW